MVVMALLEGQRIWKYFYDQGAHATKQDVIEKTRIKAGIRRCGSWSNI